MSDPHPQPAAPVTLILGGARSGKSRLAQQLAEQHTGPVVFLATATPVDDEMRHKIARHQADRPASWTTTEEPLRLAEALAAVEPGAFVLLDCLTLWTANLLHAHPSDPAALESAIAALLHTLAHTPNPIVLVSNEVGSGIVPAYELGRHYRDLLGEINQRVAALASDVILMTAGLPLPLKRAGAPVHNLSQPGTAPVAAP